ncbi:hypothetical protein F2Q69_00027501 [Brassica cretica]|uniref:Uncharacterized protein n=1 Tax=Brassica cretica TaxID=69181 RepID=A0A8S9S7J1_BRACR|nr:hypothetical protein F2Q69_00027501 [Brassica cretica]
MERRRCDAIAVELTRSSFMERWLRGEATDDPSRRDRIRIGGEGPRERDEKEMRHWFFHFLEENKETRRWGVGLTLKEIKQQQQQVIILKCKSRRQQYKINKLRLKVDSLIDHLSSLVRNLITQELVRQSIYYNICLRSLKTPNIINRRSAKRLRGKNGEEKMRHHRGGADEIFSHGAMIARQSNRRSVTMRPNPCRQRRLASTPAMFSCTLTEDELFLCPADGAIMITCILTDLGFYNRSAAVDSSGREFNRNRLIGLLSAIVLEQVRDML